MAAAASSDIPEHVEHRITTADGRTLAVAEWGDPTGVPVIALHGTPGGRIGWASDPTIYARHGIRRLTFDRPGYGESTRLPGRRVADVVPDVVAIADALGIDRFAVSGGSGGGPHALACAALAPDRVLRCFATVLLAPRNAEGLDWFAGQARANIDEFGAALQGEAALREVIEPDAKFMLERIAAGRADIVPDDWDQSDVDLEQMAKAQASLAAHVTSALAPGIDGWVDDDLAAVAPWGFELGDIGVPVYLQFGRQDGFIPEAHADWLIAHVPGAKVVISDAGHQGTDEQQEYDMAWLAGETATSDIREH